VRRGWGSWACSAGDKEVKGHQQHLLLPKRVLEVLGTDSAWRGTARAPEASAQAAAWEPQGNSPSPCKQSIPGMGP